MDRFWTGGEVSFAARSLERAGPRRLMSAPRFLDPATTLDLERLRALTGATPLGQAAPVLAITGLAAPDWAGPGDLTFVDAAVSTDDLAFCDAGACLARAEQAAALPRHVVALVVEDPARAFAAVAAVLHPGAGRPRALFGSGVSAGAAVHPEARLEPDVAVDPGAVIGAGVEIGAGTSVGANVVLGAGVRIGRDVAIGPNAVVENALVGDRVTLQAGVRLGQGAAGATGRAIVQDGVEIGANAVVERGAAGDTVLGEGARIGALARVGTGARVGRLRRVAASEAVPAGAMLDDAPETFGQAGLGAARSAL